jgi:hypothetical protein
VAILWQLLGNWRYNDLDVGTNVTRLAIGCRVKSGWAMAVLLAGPAKSPRVLDRRVVELSDPNAPESKQPYHAAMGTLEEDAAKIKRRTQVVQRVAKRSVAALLADCQAAGHEPATAGLVVGSLVDPAKIANPHVRAHALEGRLFRSVLEDSLRGHGITCQVVTERDAYAKAAVALARSEDDLKSALARLGRDYGGPWRAEEKLAALVAWMNLA